MNHSNFYKDIRRVAIIAYPDSRKDLIEWSYANKNILKNHLIISTARTATLLEGTLNVPVLNLDHGKSGGYQQLKTMLEENKVDILIFFGDPLQHEITDSWFEELVDTAIRQDAVVACNQATIDMLLTSIGIRFESHDESHFHSFLRQQIAEEKNEPVTN